LSWSSPWYHQQDTRRHVNPAEVNGICSERTKVAIHQVGSQDRHADRISKASAAAQVLSSSQEAVNERYHGTCDVGSSLGLRLEVHLRYKPIIQPVVETIIIVGVVAKLCSIRIGREIVPKGAANL